MVHFRSISGGRKGADKEQKGLLVLFFQPGTTEIEQSEDERSARLEESSLPLQPTWGETSAPTRSFRT